MPAMLLALLICVELVAGDNLVVVPLDKQYVPIYRGENVVAYKTAFFGDLFVGSSASEFSVVFDTGSGHMFLPSVQCDTESCQAHRRYNETASTSAVQLDHEGPWDGNSERDEVAISFGTGEVIGNIVEEVVCLNNKPSGSACARVRLVTANHLTDVPFKSFHFDGVVGLGLANLAVDSRFSFFEQMVGGGIVVPQFGYFISERDDVASEICFGGHDARHMRSPLQWVPVHDPQKGFWQVKVLRVTVNGEEFPFCADGSCVAMADTGTSLIGAPRAAATALHRLLARKVPAGTDPSDDIDCREVAGPELQFELEGGVLVSLGGREYSRAAAMKVINKQQEVQHVCRATLLPVDPSPMLGEKAFILGQPLLQKYYTVYDWEQQRVGFALAEQGSSETAARHKVYGAEGTPKSSTVHI